MLIKILNLLLFIISCQDERNNSSYTKANSVGFGESQKSSLMPVSSPTQIPESTTVIGDYEEPTPDPRCKELHANKERLLKAIGPTEKKCNQNSDCNFVQTGVCPNTLNGEYLWANNSIASKINQNQEEIDRLKCDNTMCPAAVNDPGLPTCGPNKECIDNGDQAKKGKILFK